MTGPNEASRKGPIPLADIARQVRGLDPASVGEILSPLFLVHRESPSEGKGRRTVRTMIATAKEQAAATNLGPVMVYPLRKAKDAPGKIITVGRTKTSDITIEDPSVSLFHAVFAEREGGLFLHDGESMNGTQLNGKPVPSQRQGKPLLVGPGDRILFGTVDMRLIDTPMLLDLCGTVPT